MPRSLALRIGKTTSPAALARHELTVQALHLRRAGASYGQIALQLGTSANASYKLIKRALDATVREAADEVRALELERLDVLLMAVWPDAVAGRLGAVDRVLAIQERRARLLGLDAQPARGAQAVAVGQFVWKPENPEVRAEEYERFRSEFDAVLGQLGGTGGDGDGDA